MKRIEFLFAELLGEDARARDDAERQLDGLLMGDAAAKFVALLGEEYGAPGKEAAQRLVRRYEVRKHGRIAYHCPAGQIWVMDFDGQNQLQLTRDRGWHPSWSPDGSLIAYIRIDRKERRGELWVCDIAGAHHRRLTVQKALGWNAGPPIWSPNGKQIAFRLEDWDGSQTYLVEVCPEGAVQPLGITRRWKPSWSPDGTRIAYVRFKPEMRIEAELWIMNVSGQDTRLLMTYRADELVEGQPVWAPDGREVIVERTYWGYTKTFRVDLKNKGAPTELIGSLPTWYAKAMTRELPGVMGSEKYHSPSISPDGRRAAVWSWEGGGCYSIYSVDLASGEASQLANGLYPAWGCVSKSRKLPRDE